MLLYLNSPGLLIAVPGAAYDHRGKLGHQCDSGHRGNLGHRGNSGHGGNWGHRGNLGHWGDSGHRSNFGHRVIWDTGVILGDQDILKHQGILSC